MRYEYSTGGASVEASGVRKSAILGGLRVMSGGPEQERRIPQLPFNSTDCRQARLMALPALGIQSTRHRLLP